MRKLMSWVLVGGLVVAGVGIATALMAQGPGKYGGTETCKMCHPDTYGEWAKSRHARGFELLVNVGEEKNVKCLPCHSTGYGNGGFVDEATTPGLKGVTCEACHGPGADHNGDKTKITRVPSAKVCADCHQQTNIHSVEGSKDK